MENYKYLGCWNNDFGDNTKIVQALTAAASHSYGRIIGIFEKFGDLGYKSFMTLFDAYVLPIANYGAAVWGFVDYLAPRVLQNKISRFYCGVHRFAPVSSTNIEMDWTNIHFIRWVELLRFHNCLMEMKSYQWPRRVYELDRSVGRNCWVNEVKKVASTLHLPGPEANVLFYLENAQAAARKLSMDKWWQEAFLKRKLRTYI